MVAVLRLYEEELTFPDRTRPATVRTVPPTRRPVTVHRHTGPRVSRSRAVVFWRRRLVAAALGLGLVLTAAHASAAALGGSTTTSSGRGGPHVVSVVAAPGDSLWSIAAKVAPHDDPRAVVDALIAARGTDAVRAGDTITWMGK